MGVWKDAGGRSVEGCKYGGVSGEGCRYDRKEVGSASKNG